MAAKQTRKKTKNRKKKAAGPKKSAAKKAGANAAKLKRRGKAVAVKAKKSAAARKGPKRPSIGKPATGKPATGKPATGKPATAKRAPAEGRRGARHAAPKTVQTAPAAARPAPRHRPTESPQPALRGRARPSIRKRAMARPVARKQSLNASGVSITGQPGPRYEEILSPAALSFVADLHRAFDKTRKELLQKRVDQQKRYDSGELPDFLAGTRPIREADWSVAPIPKDILDRRVEITGPVDRKMIINALNSGANVFMADFEDANSPTWANNIEGQINLKDLWRGEIDFTDPASGKHYRIADKRAVLFVRPRGWHLLEQHMSVGGEPVSGALFDFGLYAFHNAKAMLDQGTAPYFYLPKLETHLEARLWNDVFLFAQRKLGIPKGAIRATVLIETLPAAFEMDEILYELREHVTGLNAGRWDYIFSFIKKLAKNPNYVLPDRAQVVMGKAFLGAYGALLIKTCHRRGAFAMGGMAAQIPIKNNPAANEVAFAKVRADKEREVREGHDGTWVAHPDLVPVAKEVFDRLMPQPNQLDRLRDDVHVTRDDLLRVHEGTKTEEGFRNNIRVGVQYIEAWLRGRGAAPIYNLMEDAATAEISRAQIWQWIQYGAVLDNGLKVTPDFFKTALVQEMERIRDEIGAETFAKGRFPDAVRLFTELSLAPEFEDFLTISAYRLIV